MSQNLFSFIAILVTRIISGGIDYKILLTYDKHPLVTGHKKPRKLLKGIMDLPTHLYTNTNKEKSRPFFSKMPLAFRLITQDPLHA